MKHPHPPTGSAVRFYACLLHLYPQSYRKAFGAQMDQTFQDHYNDVRETEGKIGLGFWLAVISDELKNIPREQFSSLKQPQMPTIFLLMLAILLAGSALVFTKRIHPLMVGVMLIGAMYLMVKKQPTPPKSAGPVIKNVWRKQGFYYGVLLGLCYLPLSVNSSFLVGPSQLPTVAKFIVAAPFVLGMPTFLALSGFHAGKRSSEAQQGTLAGLLTASIGALLLTSVMMLSLCLFWPLVKAQALPSPSLLRAWQHRGPFDAFLWRNNLGGALFLSCFTVICGGILGTLGGFVGASGPERAKY